MQGGMCLPLSSRRGVREGVVKGRKGGVLSDQEKWKWNDSLEYLKRKFGLSELLADGTTEVDTLLCDVGENIHILFLKRYDHCEQSVFLTAPGVLSLFRFPLLPLFLTNHLLFHLVWLLTFELCAHIFRIKLLFSCSSWICLFHCLV